MVIIRGPWPERSQDEEVSRPDAPVEPARAAARSYRQRDDPRHLRRFMQDSPKGLPRKVADFVEVAGISQPEASRNATVFLRGDDLSLELEPDPANRFDSNAIKVVGVWRDPMRRDVRRAQIGWVPARLAAQIAQLMPGQPIAATLVMGFLPHDGNSPGVRFALWGPRGSPKL